MMTTRKKRKKRSDRIVLQLAKCNICLWPGILTAVVVLLPIVVGQDVPGTVTTTSYPSGVSCGSDPQRRCLTQASCSPLGVCTCPAETYGNGDFMCYQTNSIRAEITDSPPRMLSFHNTSVGFNFPCRVRFTEFTTVRKRNGEQCVFKIFALNQIIGGKIKVTGFEVHLRLIKGSQIISEIGIRAEGRAKNNFFTYTERGRDAFIDELPVTDKYTDSDENMDGSGSGDGDDFDDENSDEYDWGSPEVLELEDGERVACEIDKDNFATVSVPSCSTGVRFRAPSGDDKQDQVSGLSVAISEDTGPVSFTHPVTYLAETEKKDIFSQSARQKNIGTELEVLHSLMQNAARQYSTPEGTECEDTARTYRSYCQNDAQKVAALESCSFFLENPKLVACMDPTKGGTSSLNAFKLCLWHSCQPSENVCNMMKSRVQKSGCLSFTPPAFSSIDCSA